MNELKHKRDLDFYKDEVVNAITNHYFEFDYPYPEGDQFNSYTQEAEIESKNFYMDVEIEVLVRFSGYGKCEYEIDEINLTKFVLFDKNGNTIFEDDFDEWDEEIINNINLSI